MQCLHLVLKSHSGNWITSEQSRLITVLPPRIGPHVLRLPYNLCVKVPQVFTCLSSVKSLESPDVETGRQSFKNGAQNSKKKNHHVLAWWFVRDKVASLTSCSCYRNLNISVLATTISGWEGGAMSDQLRLASFVRKLHTLSARDTYLQTRAEWHTNKNKENKEHRLHNLSDNLLKMLQQHKQSG